MRLSYFALMYSGDGNRKYKMTGTCELHEPRYAAMTADLSFDDVVLYPNPYITVTPKGYTKHYFMGAERFCTTIGGGNFGQWLMSPIDGITTDERDLLAILKENITYKNRYYDYYDYPHHNSHTINTNYDGTIHFPNAEYYYYQYIANEQYYGKNELFFTGSLEESLYLYSHDERDDEPFYYHSNHLGSATWITNKYGLPVQYIMYAPYGEQLLNQQSTSYNERFTFTGKERDIETGYVHFDARNLFEVASIWLSPDPLLDKYIYNSPYVYCDGNPIKYVDPDGRDVWELSDDGTIKARIRDKTQDAIAIKGKSISFDYGTIDMGVHGRERNNTNYTYFQFAEGKENEAAAAFKFLADNSSVEYALVNTDKNVSGVYTNRNKDYVYSGFAAARVEGFTGAKMTDNYHSHTNGTMFPSGLTDVQGDMRFAKNKGDSYNYYIYPAKSNGVIEYFSNGSYISMLQPWPYKNVGTISPYVRQSGIPALLRKLGIKW